MSRMAQRLRGGGAESAHDPAHRGIIRGILGQNREVYGSIVSQASNLCVHSDASNNAPSHWCAPRPNPHTPEHAHHYYIRFQQYHCVLLHFSIYIPRPPRRSTKERQNKTPNPSISQPSWVP